MRFNTVLIIASLLVLVSLSSLTGYFILRDSDGEKYTVTRVIDGDTIEVEELGTVRLLGINTPEQGTYYSKEATDFLTKLIQGKDVKLEAIEEDEDQYGRLLRYVFLGDTFVNLELVEGGYAVVYILNPNEDYYLEFKQAENEAKNKKIGLWGAGKSLDCIAIASFSYDAVGNDNENMNGEYVTFQNKCDDAISMNGWTVKDTSTANKYTFSNFVFDGDSTFTLYTGSGSNTGTELYWGRKDYAVWNNNGDTLFLRDGEGSLVLSYSYP